MGKKMDRSKDAPLDKSVMFALTNYGVVRCVEYKRAQCHETAIQTMYLGDEEKYRNDWKRGIFDIRKVRVVPVK